MHNLPIIGNQRVQFRINLGLLISDDEDVLLLREHAVLDKLYQSVGPGKH